jgi:hypothetical protein
MPLSVAANEVLKDSKLRLLFEYDGNKLAEDDVYIASGPLAGEWLRRIVQEPRFATSRASRALGGLVQIDKVEIVVWNGDGYFNTVFTAEKRKTSCAAHLYDLGTGETQQGYFLGELYHFESHPPLMTLTFQSLDTSRLTGKIPVSHINSTQFPSANKQALGAVVALGQGIGLHVPARFVYDPKTGEGGLYEFIVCTGNVGIDIIWRGSDPLATRVENYPGINGETDPVAAALVYEVLPRTYKIDGRWCYAFRVKIRPAVNLTEPLPVTVDLQGVYPPWDDAVVDEWKFKGTTLSELAGETTPSAGYGITPYGTGPYGDE